MPNKTKDSKPKKHDDELWDALALAEDKRYNELTLKQAIKVNQTIAMGDNIRWQKYPKNY